MALSDYTFKVTRTPEGHRGELSEVEVVALSPTGKRLGRALGVWGEGEPLGPHLMQTTMRGDPACRIFDFYRFDQAAWLDIVEVEASAARHGIGRGLMQVWLAQADEAKVKATFLTVTPLEKHSPDRDRLVRFYESFGFRLDAPEDYPYNSLMVRGVAVGRR